MPWGDQSILNEIIGQSRDLSPHLARLFRRAAVQTGLVESGGRNLAGGDADSEGWRQERKSLYPNPRNVRASVSRFKQEFLQQYQPGEKAWQVAAQVQRPAAQYRGRYHDVAGEANQILHAAMSGKGGGGGGNAGPLTDALSTQGAGNQPQGSEGILALVSALAESKQAPASSGLQAPAFSAQAAMPNGAAVPSSSGAPQPKQDPSALLDAVRTVGGDVQHAPGLTGGGGAQASSAGGGGGGQGGLGKVVVNPGANRAGVPLQPGALKFARRIAGLLGEPVHIGTGTNHDQMTVSGNVSDHWRGEGVDIPGSGRQLVRLGQAALIAAGMSEAQARKQRGGAYRVGGKQIIFNSNLPGYGDHTDHLHVGLSRRRG